MKNFFAVILISFTIHPSFSQETERKNIVSINFLPSLYDHNTSESYFLAGLQFKLDYERFIKRSFTPSVAIGFTGPVTFDFANSEGSESIPTSGITISLGNKFFLSKDVTEAKGFYLMPFAGFQMTRFNEAGDNPNSYLQFKDIFCSGVIGWQTISKKHIVLDIYSGMGILFRNYYDTTLSESTVVTNVNQTGIKPELGLRLGYNF